MVRVAICDDNKHVVEHVKGLMGQIREVDQCDGYHKPHDLIQRLKLCGEEYFRVVLLGAEHGREGEGIEAARQIHCLNPNTRIIFMAEDSNRCIQQILLQMADLFGFLLKPVDRDILQEYIRKALNDGHREKEDCLVIRSRGVMLSVRCNEILYLESAGHTVNVRTKCADYCCYGRLETLMEQLPDHFVQCHKSYLVNMREIQKIEQKWILMSHEILIPISKSRSKDTKNRFFEYMRGLSPSNDKMEKAGVEI